jgi:cytochrome c biogenesis protein CcmG/thiol:disulfide interchange protein DsbE
MKKNIWPLVLLAVAMVGLSVFQSRRPGIATALSGPAPSWELADLNGKPLRSDDFKGRVLFLNFWATWCPPCRQEIPDFVAFTREMDTNRVVIVGLSLDDGVDAVRSLARSYSINYPLAMANDEIREKFGGLGAIPTTFVIDPQGNFAARYLGLVKPADLRKWTEQLQKK